MNKIDKLSNLHIKVVGVNLENLVFDLSCAGVVLKHVKRKNKQLSFVVSGQNYQSVLACAKKYDQSVSVIRTSGAINIIKKLPYSIGAFVGIIISCFFVHIATRTIARVDLSIIDRQNQETVDQNKSAQIRTYLREIGIGEGLCFDGKIKNAENMLIAQFDYVESCFIEKTGNYVKVTIKEASAKSREQSKIVADKNGIVESIVTFAGFAKVKAGDVIKAGQVLVEAKNNIMPKAQINIKTWAVGTAFHYDKSQVKVRTGKKQISKAINLWNWQILKHSACKYDMYETEVVESSINNILPINIETIVFYQTKIQEITQPFESVKDKIYEEAKNEAIKRAGTNVSGFSYSVIYENGVAKVDCYAEIHYQIVS